MQASLLKISRILHAGYVFEFQGQQIAFDPLFEVPFSKNCYAFPEVSFDLDQVSQLQFSAVFISHFHDDHCSLESLNRLDRKTPIYLFCIHEDLFTMIRQLGFESVFSLDLEIPLQVGPFQVTPHRALDADVDCLFEVQAGDLRILNVVDSWIDESMMTKLTTQKTWDLILWPFQTMREMEVIAPRRADPSDGQIPAELKEQIARLQPRILVPSSCQFRQEEWSWYNKAFFPISYASFARQIVEILPQTQVQRMDPGQSFLLSESAIQDAGRLSWIRRKNESPVDYEYDPNLQVPSAAEVSRHFADIDPRQKDQVRSYCQNGLALDFQKYGPWDCEYFEDAKKYVLKVHFSDGLSEVYHYAVDNKNLTLIDSQDDPADWLTEISATKLYSALTTGETLTSLYLRINDCDFSPATEEKIKEVDIGEDPLIRCLFTDKILAYQEGQLERLLKFKCVGK